MFFFTNLCSGERVAGRVPLFAPTNQNPRPGKHPATAALPRAGEGIIDPVTGQFAQGQFARGQFAQKFEFFFGKILT